jgi:hypothetical protein
VLFGFYLLFNYFSKEYINYLLTAYFGVFGAFSVAKMLVAFGKTLIPEKCYMFDFVHVFIERKKDGKPKIRVLMCRCTFGYQAYLVAWSNGSCQHGSYGILCVHQELDSQ